LIYQKGILTIIFLPFATLDLAAFAPEEGLELGALALTKPLEFVENAPKEPFELVTFGLVFGFGLC